MNPLLAALPMFLLSLAPYLAPPLIAFLTLLVTQAMAKLPANERDMVAQVVQTSVHATEQFASDQMNSVGKKQMATDFVEKELAYYKINVPDAMVSAMIEEWVSRLNMAADAKPTIVLPPTAGIQLNPVKGGN